jgi:hypothetical protein
LLEDPLAYTSSLPRTSPWIKVSVAFIMSRLARIPGAPLYNREPIVFTDNNLVRKTGFHWNSHVFKFPIHFIS